MSNLGRLRACLKEFGISTMSDFDSRFKVQKYTYFAIRFGLDLDFDFNLYKRGPYSPSLTAAAFSVVGENNTYPGTQLTDKEKEIIQKTRNFVEGLTQRDLEIMTTLDYLYHIGCGDGSREAIERRLKQLKPWTAKISEDEMKQYWRKLEEYELVPRPETR